MPIAAAFPNNAAPIATTAPAAEDATAIPFPDITTLKDKEWVVRFRPYEPGVGEANVWFSSRGLATNSTSPFPDTPMDRIIESPWAMRVSSISGGSPGQSAKPSLGNIILLNLNKTASGEWDLAEIASWYWGDRGMEIYIGEPDETDFTNFHKVFSGITVGPPELEFGKATVPIRTNAQKLNSDFQTEIFTGLGGSLECNGSGVAICDHHCAGLIYEDGAWTMEFWVKRLSDTGNATSRIISKEDHWDAYIDEGGGPSEIRFRCINPADATNYSFGWNGANLVGVGWHHVAIVVPENHNITTRPVRCYFDSEVQALDTTASPAGTIDFGTAINLGGLDATTENSDVQVNEIRIWRGERTASEIADSYQEPIDQATENLQWYWRFDEGLGTEAFNETLQQPFDATVAFAGPAGVLDDVVTVDESVLLNPHSEEGEMSLELWMSPHTLPSVLGTTVILAGKAQAYRIVWETGDDKIKFALHNGTDWSTHLAVAATAITDDHRLYHVVATLSTAGAMTLYVNGASVGTDTGATGLPSTTFDFTYGANRNTAGVATNFFDGNISWVRLWNKALSADEVANTIPFKVYGVNEDPRLVGQWLNNEPTGTDCFDTSGNGLNGVLVGGAPRRLAKFNINDEDATVWTNTAEGTPDLAGQTKPFGLGYVVHAPGVEIDPPNAVWMWHGGEVESLVNAFEDGLQFDKGIAVDDVWIDPATGAPPVVTGDYIYSLDPLVIRFAETPTGTVTATFEGDNAGTRGYQEFPGKLARRVATRGNEGLIGVSETDDDAIDTLDDACPVRLGYFLASGENPSRAEIITKIMDSIYGIWTITRDGRFRPIAVPDESWTAKWTVDDDSLFSILKVPAGPPVWRLTLKWGRYWNDFDRTDLAGALTDSQKATLAEEWRTKVHRDSAILDTNRDATSLEVETLIVDAADAITQASRRFELLKTEREMWDINPRGGIEADVAGLVPMWFNIEVGDVISVTSTDAGLSGNYIALNWEEDAKRQSLIPRVWGPSA